MVGAPMHYQLCRLKELLRDGSDEARNHNSGGP